MYAQILILKFFSSQCSIGQNFVSYSVSKQRQKGGTCDSILVESDLWISDYKPVNNINSELTLTVDQLIDSL